MAEAIESITIRLPVTIPVQRLRDLLCSAVEQGSHYWADFYSIERSPDLDYLRVRVIEREEHLDDVPAINRELCPEDLVVGLERLAVDPAPFPAARRHLAEFIAENDDAETADVILQMCVFGEVVYG